MNFFLTDENRFDVGQLPATASIDIDVGDTEDFQLKAHISDRSICVAGGYIYCPGTEYGGQLHNPETNTEEHQITMEGPTFRGMLNNRFVLVPSGVDYRTVSGDVLNIIRTLIGEHFDTLFYVPSGTLGVTVTYKFPRYYSLLRCLESMLAEVDCRLVIVSEYGSDGNLAVKVTAEAVTDLSELVEYSQDSGVNFKIRRNTFKKSYILALGGGTLQERMVSLIHLKTSGYETVTSFPKNVPIYRYENTNAESLDDLIKGAVDSCKDNNGSDKQEMTIPEDSMLKIGNIVAGRDYVTGMYIKQKVTGMIIKQTGNKTEVSYKIGG